MDAAPGKSISIEITARPRRAAAQKTLLRLCGKDPVVAKPHRRQKGSRPSWQEWIRGGKYWHHQMKSKPAATIEPGRVFTVRASVDVMRDLESVKDCVKVTAR
jgi:hypothetical protein